MEQNEGFIDRIINSLKYTVSDAGALLWGGVVAFLCMFIVGIPFLLGYTTRCGREVLKGNNRLPAWNNLDELVKDGVMVIVIMAFFALIMGLLFVLTLPFFIAGGIYDSFALTAIGIFLLMPTIAVGIVLSMLIPAAWIEYAVTGDLVRAINPINALRIAAANPIGFIVALIATIIVSVILAIPSVFVVTAPWVTFIGYTSSAYIYARFYQQTMEAAPFTGTGGHAAATV